MLDVIVGVVSSRDFLTAACMNFNSCLQASQLLMAQAYARGLHAIPGCRMLDCFYAATKYRRSIPHDHHPVAGARFCGTTYGLCRDVQHTLHGTVAQLIL